MKELNIVVPCYNEEKVIETFYESCKEILKNLTDVKITYIFVDDGSKDKTLEKIIKLSKNQDVSYISFTRNFGKEAAILSGLKYSKGDYVVLMDSDLQHPPSLIVDMLNGVEDGFDSVAAKRVARKNERGGRILFSKLFYKLSQLISDVYLVQGATDYRMMSREMVDSILEMTEYNRFSKGIFEWVGYNTKWIEYEDVERTIGDTKWNFFGLVKYAIDGLISFSVKPLKMASIAGGVLSLFSIFYAIFELVKTFVFGIDVPGYASLMVLVSFVGGVQLISLGIIGEYLSLTYLEVKNRPSFVIKDMKLSK